MTPRTIAAIASVAVLFSSAAAFATTTADKSPAAAQERARAQTQADAIVALLRKKDYQGALDAAKKLIEAFPRNPIGLTMQGSVYFAKEDFAAARASYEKALSVQADYEPAMLNLAQLDLRDKNVAAAQTRYQKILAKDPRNLVAMLGMSNVEAANRNEAESLAWLQRAKAARPEANGPRLLLANRYLAAKNYDKAIVELNEAQRLQPNSADVLDALGRAQVTLGKRQDAVATYKKLVALRPQSPEAYRELGSAQLGVKDIAGATASYNKALELQPNYVDAMAGLVAVNVQMKKHGDALKLARRIQTLAPNQPTGVALEADVLADQQEYAQAVTAYDRALAMSPTSTLAIKRHAAQSKAGNAADANASLQKFVADHPDDNAAALYLAQELARAGQTKQASALYESVLKRDPRSLIAINNLANMYRADKDPRAMPTAEEAYRLHPNSPVVADTLGWMLVEDGQAARGLELLQKALVDAPTNLQIRYHVAAALAKAGDKELARKQLEELLAKAEQFPQRQAAEALLKQL